ncbi:hypothetical protein N7447_007762 [Penicillium robsamsonii]|uniref:uncharacterized protein n=1 Tax=Penicillium robsamsonii TaxID=1792511 RepID=UPI002546961E|nr:uncharacterized protein N7447_007762 [Penicillium robsamsonii]KAJ5817754.1 hypothetical protein N7447_007762 [Penicillium robsamsonii]
MPMESPSMNSKVCFSAQDLAVIKKSDEAQYALRGYVHEHGKFSEKEKIALKLESVESFGRFWTSTQDAKQKFDAGHHNGIRSEMQSFASSACDILQNLEPILTLIKDFGAPYGSMAIGTISFIFTVVNQRAQTESLISNTLLEIRDRIPGLNLYRHIYSEDHDLDRALQSKIVEAYDRFISFCIEATKYYMKRGIRRWLNAIFGSMTLKDQSSETQRAIVEVRRSSEELLSKNVDTIKQLNKDLKRQIKQLQDGHNSNTLSMIQSLLNLETYSAESEQDLLRKYQDEIKVYPDLHWPDSLERMQEPELQAFQQGQEFHSWRHSNQSSILMLVGYNNESIYRDGMCWMSPAALHMIESMSKDRQKDPYAFYLLGQRQMDLLPQVLSSIVIQLLRQNREALQNQKQYDELYAAVQQYHQISYNQPSSQKELVRHEEALLKVALRALDMFDLRKTVWIILDRVDQCKHGGWEANHRKMLVRAMVRLVEGAKVKVKVLAVVNGYDWNADNESDEFGQIKTGAAAEALI